MKIEKRNYSRSPWRLISSDGKELQWERPMKHPDLGQTWVTEPVMGGTKAECLENVLELLSLCLRRLQAGHCKNPASVIDQARCESLELQAPATKEPTP